MGKLFQLMSTCMFFNWKLAPVLAEVRILPEVERVTIIGRMAVRMIESCYADYKTLVIHEDVDLPLIKSKGELNFLNLIMLTNNTMAEITYQQRMTMSLFLMTSESDEQVHEILMVFKQTGLWNIMNPLFILDKSDHSNEIPKIYTYNPYTNRAPEPWQKSSTPHERSDGWTMFSLSYYEGGSCGALNFDRTSHLDGAVVRVVTNLLKPHTWIPGKDYDDSILEKKKSIFFSRLAAAMKYALNVTLVINIDEVDYASNNNSIGFYRRLRNGSSDIALILRSPHITGCSSTTYTVLRSNYYITTNHRGFYTPWERFKNYYGIVTLISISIILPITYIVIFFSTRGRKWSFAGFEILRLIVNAAILTEMNTLSKRIFFAMIFLYFLIIHATFQGHLSTFLTGDQSRKNVESLEDLKDMRYTAIHVSPGIVPIITDPVLKPKLVVGQPNCSALIIGNDSSACVADIFYLYQVVFESKLHLSKIPVSPSQYCFPVRDDWPLKKRVDIFLMQLEQGGFSRRWDEEYLKEENARQKRILSMMEVNFRSISLSMLDFAYLIFAVGLLFGIICFLFEKAIVEFSIATSRRHHVLHRNVNVQRS